MSRIVLAGVSGSGKTTIGQLLADRLGCPFLDADDFHPPENLAKMRAGTPLDDTDRAAWLTTLGETLATQPATVVLACSALKRAYRDRLRELAPDLHFFLLTVDPAELRRRLESRADTGEHFMPASLLDSQLATLESDNDLTQVPNQGDPKKVAERMATKIAGNS